MGARSNLTQLSEIMQGTGYKHALKHVDKYMKAENDRHRSLLAYFACRVTLSAQGRSGHYVALNFPIAMVFVPLCNAITAGNRAIIGFSEFNPAMAELIKPLIEQNFSSDEVAVFTGGAEVGAAFSAVPFDHLFFTGASSIGQKVMEAAAKNLTSVITLELVVRLPVLH